MIKLFFIITTFITSHSILAQVPTKAFTFDTDIEIFNATTTQRAKIEKATQLIKDVIATDEFRTRVLNHTYNGVKTFVDNDGLTNLQIYNKILDGAEELNKILDNEMDLQIETYYTFSSTVGYTYSDSPKIYMNTKFLDSYTPADVTGNMMHEWLHKLGFSHAYYYSTSRDYSVPYAIGEIMSRLAYTVTTSPVVTLKPATNLALTSTSSDVTLKWSAATSSAGISEYKIYRKLAGSTTSYLQGTTTALTFTQRAPSKSATYYVKAVDRTGKTINSTTASYVKPTATLTAPSNVTLTQTTTQVTIKWNAAAAAVSYKVYRKLEGSTSIYRQVTTTALSFTQTKPSKSATYYVRSVDAQGNTMKSAEVKLTL